MERSKKFVLEFVSQSRNHKQQFLARWREVLENFMVSSDSDVDLTSSDPYRKSGRGITGQTGRTGKTMVFLKDSETHKAIMTFASKLATSVIGDPRYEYVHARPVGYEDADRKAETVTKLLRYNFGMPGVFRTFVEAIIDMLLFGTAIIEVGWKYETREMLVRSIEESEFGVDDVVTRQSVIAYDDATLSTVDPQDFFYDPSEYRIENMSGVAKKFEMTAMRARHLAEIGVYDKAAVERAITAVGKSSQGSNRSYEEDIRENVDQPEKQGAHSDFSKMIGYEYWGDVPWKKDEESSRRVITVLNNEVVRDRDYPYADPELPFIGLTINPVQGRFFGVSPAEVIRHDQDLADVIKGLTAEAIIKGVRPPHIYNKDADVDLAKLFSWRPDSHVGVSGDPNAAVSTVKYDSNVYNGFALSGDLKRGMQEASGALGLLQGTGLGVNRASATEAQFSAQNAMDRPELAAMILERDSMPRIAKALLRRNQQFIVDDADLALRVGELPKAVWIGDILGDYDVQFVGSRIAMTRQEKLQAVDRLATLSAAIPQAGMQVPWQLVLQRIIGENLELPEIAALVGSPDILRQNLILQQILGMDGATGNGNGTAQIGEPAGALPAQVNGGVGG